MKVTKEFEFEAAHRLSNYEGKCKRIHGHSYKGKVTVEGASLDSRGILVDFGEIKDAVEVLIVNEFDHRLILKKGDPFNEEVGLLLSKLHDDSIVWVDYNPTAENLAIDFKARLNAVIPFSSVELFETPDSSVIAE